MTEETKSEDVEVEDVTADEAEDAPQGVPVPILPVNVNLNSDILRDTEGQSYLEVVFTTGLTLHRYHLPRGLVVELGGQLLQLAGRMPRSIEPVAGLVGPDGTPLS